jgi:hypothetical protein
LSLVINSFLFFCLLYQITVSGELGHGPCTRNWYTAINRRLLVLWRRSPTACRPGPWPRRGGEPFDARRRVDDVADLLVAARLGLAQLLVEHEAEVPQRRQMLLHRRLAQAQIRRDPTDGGLGHQPAPVVQPCVQGDVF